MSQGTTDIHEPANRYSDGGGDGAAIESSDTHDDRSKKRSSSALSCSLRAPDEHEPGTDPLGAPPACASENPALPHT